MIETLHPHGNTVTGVPYQLNELKQMEQHSVCMCESIISARDSETPNVSTKWPLLSSGVTITLGK